MPIRPVAPIPPALAAPHVDALWRDARRDMAVAALGLALGGALLVSVGAVAPPAVAITLAAYALATLLIWRGLADHRPQPRFGAANRVTLLRLALVCGLVGALGAGLIGAGWTGAGAAGAGAAGGWTAGGWTAGGWTAGAGVVWPGVDTPVTTGSGASGWPLVAVAAVAALLDAVDGPLARARGSASRFGARFDMETDALLTLVLSALVWQGGRAGAWVLASGLMRYAFVAAACARPWLGRTLPPSRRRQAVCVVQITSLITALLPVLPPAAAVLPAAAGLAALTASFAADLRWLAQRRRLPLETAR